MGVGEGGFMREAEELRARDVGYTRQGVGHHQVALASRLGNYARLLQRSLRDAPPTRAQLPSTLLEVAKLSRRALEMDTDRISIWLFDAEQRRLTCSSVLSTEAQAPASSSTPAGRFDGTRICPRYIAALAETHVLAVDDVLQDARTAELRSYLRGYRIGALLDIRIAIPGALLGVISHEHVGGPRIWQREEIDFAANVGSLVALALHAERRLSAERLGLGSEARYQSLIEALPVTVYTIDARSSELSYVSPNIERLTGWSEARWREVGAQAWIERVHPDDRPRLLARFQRLGLGLGQGQSQGQGYGYGSGAAGNASGELTYRVRMPGGRQCWVRDTWRLTLDPLGHALAIQGVLSDVTQQVEAEQARS